MALLNITQERYYNNSTNFTGTGFQTEFVLTEAMFNPLPSNKSELSIFVNGKEINVNNYSYTSPTITFSADTNNTDVLQSTGAPKSNLLITVVQISADDKLGNYQHTTLADIVNNFMVSYVGEEKIIPKVKRNNVLFFAQRAIQELSYDTLRSEKSQEIEVPTSLEMKLPHDYVGYVKLSFIDNSGIERLIHPIRITSNSTALLQDNNYNYLFDSTGELLTANESEAFKRFKSSETESLSEDDFYLEDDRTFQALHGRRFGSDPEFMGANGSFFIDNSRGKIFFSGHLSGKIITLKYISDGVATAEEKIVHKFAEEAMYKSIAYAVLSTRANTPEYMVARFKKEKFAAIRQAKLRLSNIKSEGLAQVLRGKSKWIKH
ncbi:MAG: hypothetical protein HKN86_01470 [Acidimicrobiia bacterium]|nr:hypothetical protein [Acidimicrobiia bacterium]